ncbi:hypothetical protein ACOME3_000213 [Neoechinorhynchus agilis]
MERASISELQSLFSQQIATMCEVIASTLDPINDKADGTIASFLAGLIERAKRIEELINLLPSDFKQKNVQESTARDLNELILRRNANFEELKHTLSSLKSLRSEIRRFIERMSTYL